MISFRNSYRYFVTAMFLLLCFPSWGERLQLTLAPVDIDLTHINQKDEFGRKQGLWCSYRENFPILNRYENDKLEGIERCYSYDHLAFIYYYKDGKLSEEFLLLEYGQPMGLDSHIQPNVRFQKEAIWARFPDPQDSYQSYGFTFNNNGTLSCEGWSIFKEDIWDSLEVGEHKLYKYNRVKTTNYSQFLEKEYLDYLKELPSDTVSGYDCSCMSPSSDPELQDQYKHEGRHMQLPLVPLDIDVTGYNQRDSLNKKYLLWYEKDDEGLRLSRFEAARKEGY